MSPEVTTALIAATSTVGVAVLGLAGALSKTSRSGTVSQQTAHDKELWKKRSALYGDLFTYLAIRAAARVPPVGGPNSTEPARPSPDSPRFDRIELGARIREYASHDVKHALVLLNVVETRARDAAKKSPAEATLNGVDRKPEQQTYSTCTLLESWRAKIAMASQILENLMYYEIQRGLPRRRSWVARHLRPRERCFWPCPDSDNPFPPMHAILSRYGQR